MMWHEDHLWNITVLQRVHLSNLVVINVHFTDILQIAGLQYLFLRTTGSFHTSYIFIYVILNE
jgi:hypothetical protein